MNYIRSLNIFYKLMAVTICLFIISGIAFSFRTENESVVAYSQKGSQGTEVEAIQQTLKDRGLFFDEVTGYFGDKTQEAVLKFQKQQGLSQTGVADEATLKRLGITIGSIPPATQANVNLLARIISAEGRGEPYIGQVAIGAVIMNRIEHPSFPDTLAGIIYENGAFTAVVDGQFDEPVADSAYDAARDALAGWDPTGGCIYYYNPKKTSNQFMMSRPVQKVIGDHYFCT
ncbi:MAG: cell wall hydrolase [Ruminiclostridium sp.]